MSANVNVLWRSPAPKSQQQVMDLLQRRLRGRVKAAYLFGSYARNQAHGDSDVDLILVGESPRPPTERFKDFLDLYEDFAALDVVVYTPEEWQALAKRPNTLVLNTQSHWLSVFPD